MIINFKDKNTVIKILDDYIKSNNITVYRLEKNKIISRKTYDKMKKDHSSGISDRTIIKLLKNLNFPNKDKEILKKIISEKSNTTLEKKSKKIDEDLKIIINDIFKELKSLSKNYSEELRIKKVDFSHYDLSNNYLKERKLKSFNSDFENRTLLVTAMWDFNNTILEKWKDFNMLLAINNKQDNIKMKKGLLNIASNLKEIAKKIEEAAYDKDNFNKDIINEDGDIL